MFNYTLLTGRVAKEGVLREVPLHHPPLPLLLLGLRAWGYSLSLHHSAPFLLTVEQQEEVFKTQSLHQLELNAIPSSFK